MTNMRLVKNEGLPEVSTLGNDPRCMVCKVPFKEGDIVVQVIKGKVAWDCDEHQNELTINFFENEHEAYHVAHVNCTQN